MLQNNAFVEPGAEVETIEGNLLRVVNRPKVVKNCVKMHYGTVLEEQTRDCAGNWKKSLPRNLFTGQFDTKQTQFLKQPRKWPAMLLTRIHSHMTKNLRQSVAVSAIALT